MKIIKRGKWTGNRITCNTCKSILEYKEEDIKWSKDIDGTSCSYIKCPVCNSCIDDYIRY